MAWIEIGSPESAAQPCEVVQRPGVLRSSLRDIKATQPRQRNGGYSKGRTVLASQRIIPCGYHVRACTARGGFTEIVLMTRFAPSIWTGVPPGALLAK